ncbi:hypothetical protein M407DRAFT_164686 [Tulasnella calospora MUT 4182]|uniref:Uncharacterized protein n=1 Tax=Tulasnella calospora MUT 4182 TaxID=1051891 RepID=A0A0C3M7J6_9AGAM|nr:hypothetical protein M407DRAFT_164686 [Tulasnella calospora MUT 4182]
MPELRGPEEDGISRVECGPPRPSRSNSPLTGLLPTLLLKSLYTWLSPRLLFVAMFQDVDPMDLTWWKRDGQSPPRSTYHIYIIQN